MKRENLIPGLILLFIASLFFSFASALKGILMGVLILTCFFEGSPREKFLLLKERKYGWFMVAFALWLVISFFASENRTDGARFLELRVPLLLFPISLGLIRLRKDQRNSILLGISVIVTIACLISLLYAVTRYWEKNDTAWLYNDAVTYFVGQQSIYTSILVNISIYVFAYHLFFSGFSKGRKIALAAGMVFLFIISYLLASRNMMVVLYTTVIIFSFYNILARKKYLQGAVLLLGILIAGSLVLAFFPKTVNRFKELAFTQFNFQSQAKESHYAGNLTPDQWNGANFRLAAWQCGWELFKEHPLAGVGLGDKKDELIRVYRQKQFHFAIDTRKNVHNNYLDILFSLGVAGLLLFLTGWLVLPLITALRNRDGLTVLILFTFMIAMLTENYFDRSIGVMLFVFFVTFLLSSCKPKPKSSLPA